MYLEDNVSDFVSLFKKKKKGPSEGEKWPGKSCNFRERWKRS